MEIQDNGEETDTEIQNVTEAELEDTADEQNITESSSAASANEDSEGQERHLRHQKHLLRSRNTHIRELVMQRILSRERFQEQLLRP